MSKPSREPKPQPTPKPLVLEFPLEDAPEKVWRAVSEKAFREQWLPSQDLVDEEPLSRREGEEVRYRIRDDAPPYLESVVTFQVRPAPEGGATLRIIHELADPRLKRPLTAANANRPPLMLAA